ncbi:MAG TPA: hypothetical protein VNO20_05685, partial [Solirubrobacterales bacterium]|nr:hypothetical protein [Solirubrobacterales bacterium]
MRWSIRILLTVAACLAVPAAAQAAAPFTAGSGAGPTVAVGPDGTGHVVWVTTESDVKIGYCRISPGASACNRTELISFPGATDANSAGKARVFAPVANKVVIVASCWNCGAGGVTDRNYRWLSTDNGSSFPAPLEIGNDFRTEGFGTWLEDVGIFVAASSSRAKAAFPGGEGVQYATGGTFVFGPQVVLLPGTGKLVAATNDLDVVKYGVYVGGLLTVGSINAPGNWQIEKTLPAAEGDNRDTSLTAGPNGVTLAYEETQSNPDRVGLRRFDSGSNSFGSPVYVQGNDPIDTNSLQEPDSFQDPSGRIHVAWVSLFGGGRLRYVVSDGAGNNFGAAATLAKSESFNEPELAAGGDGRGFATWTSGFTGPIRVVPLDPQAESGSSPSTPPDTIAPGVTGFGISDTTLTPGQSAKFTFNSTEAGLAVLTFEKRFLGIKGKRKGKKACLPRTKKRLSALRKRAGTPRDFKKLLKKKKCTGYRKIGEIRQ